jgi:hypothetical protein
MASERPRFSCFSLALRPSYVQLFSDSVQDLSKSASGVLLGSVKGWRGTYGFIAHTDFPDDVFFSASAVKNLRERGQEVNLLGQMVRFIPERGNGPRHQASWVEIEW